MSAGSHGHFGGSESRNGGAEVGQAKRRLFGVLRRLVSTPQMFLKKNNLKDEDSENDPLVSCWAHFYFVFNCLSSSQQVFAEFLLRPGPGICGKGCWVKLCPCPNHMALAGLHFPCPKKEGVYQAAQHAVILRVEWDYG